MPCPYSETDNIAVPHIFWSGCHQRWGINNPLAQNILKKDSEASVGTLLKNPCVIFILM